MRVIWQDSFLKETKPIKYRGHFATREKAGWSIDVPGDTNLYANHYCAQNAIDKHLGGNGIRGEAGAKRKAHGIRIIGQKEDAPVQNHIMG